MVHIPLRALLRRPSARSVPIFHRRSLSGLFLLVLNRRSTVTYPIFISRLIGFSLNFAHFLDSVRTDCADESSCSSKFLCSDKLTLNVSCCPKTSPISSRVVIHNASSPHPTTFVSSVLYSSTRTGNSIGRCIQSRPLTRARLWSWF